MIKLGTDVRERPSLATREFTKGGLVKGGYSIVKGSSQRGV